MSNLPKKGAELSKFVEIAAGAEASIVLSAEQLKYKHLRVIAKGAEMRFISTPATSTDLADIQQNVLFANQEFIWTKRDSEGRISFFNADTVTGFAYVVGYLDTEVTSG